MSEMALPALSIIEDGGGENTGEAVCGDEIQRFYTLTRTTAVDPPTSDTVPEDESILIRHQVMGTGEQTTVQVGAWSVAPERSLLLHAAARWALFHERGLLHQRGIHEVSWRSGGVPSPAPELQPRVGYLPMLSVTLSWTFRSTRREVVPNRVTIGSGSFTV